MTTWKTLLASAVLAASPVMALAECGWSAQQHVNMSCAEGSTWSDEARACVPLATS